MNYGSLTNEELISLVASTGYADTSITAVLADRLALAIDEIEALNDDLAEVVL